MTLKYHQLDSIISRIFWDIIRSVEINNLYENNGRKDAFDGPKTWNLSVVCSLSVMFLTFLICQTFITNNIQEFNSCTSRDSCSSGKQIQRLLFKNKRNKKERDPQQRSSHVGPADSQIRSYRERRCSRRTPGPPPASLLSSQSPSSPRRRSSEGEGEEAEKKKKRRLKRGRWCLRYRL